MVRNRRKRNKVYAKKVISLTIIFILAFGFFTLRFKNSLSVYAQSNSSYIVIEASTNRVLKGENIDERLPMASTTKIMTAIIVLENCDINGVVTIPTQAVGVEGSSIYLKAGEKVMVIDLLYGLMLRSGNDSAVALAIYTAGSVDDFCKLMNQKVADLGLKNTNFTNPHGSHSANHYTSAYDLAVISSYAMKNDSFKNVVGTKSISIESEIDNESQNKTFVNKNKILTLYDGGNGIKTGYTKNAGRCLVASSEKNGMEVIAVALNRPKMFEDCMSLMDYAHDNYCLNKIILKNEPLTSIRVTGGYQETTSLICKNDVFVPLKSDGSEQVSFSLDIPDYIIAPSKNSKFVGYININIDNRLQFSQKLYTIEDIDKRTPKNDLIRFFGLG